MRRGSLVICPGGSAPCGTDAEILPPSDRIYTVRDSINTIDNLGIKGVGIYLEEIINPRHDDGHEIPYNILHFKEIDLPTIAQIIVRINENKEK